MFWFTPTPVNKLAVPQFVKKIKIKNKIKIKIKIGML